MRTITLRPQPLTDSALALLERRFLVRRLRPSARLARDATKMGRVETVYCSHHRFGSHKLICVKKNCTSIHLNSHAAPEEFILISPTPRRYKPLFILVGLHTHAALARKAARRTLTARDFILLRARYNDPRTCVFTMCAGTPHCEFTLPGPGSGPVFFVTEPSRLRMKAAKVNGYRFSCGPASVSGTKR